MTQLFTILFETSKTKSQVNIPFIVNSDGTDSLVNYIKIKPSQSGLEADKEIAVDKFIEHYFPEYYPLMPGRAQSQPPGPEFEEYRDFYNTLRDDIKESLFFVEANFEPTPVQTIDELLIEESGGSIVNLGSSYFLYRCDLDLYEVRDTYDEDEKLPDFELALEIFNADRLVGIEVDSSSFNFQQAPSVLEELGGALGKLGSMLRSLQGSIPTPIDANGLETSTIRLVNKLLDFVYESSEFKNEKKNFHDTDYMTVFFDEESNITSMEYFTLNITQGETQQVKIGFFTNMLYNSMFLDPIIRNIIRNQDQIIEDVQRPGEMNQQSSLTSFLSLAGLPGGINFGLADPSIAGGLPGNNLFGDNCPDDSAAEVDVRDISALENTFSKIMSREELLELERKIDDPQYKKRLLQDQKARKLNAGIQVIDSINNVLNFNFPISGPNQTKEQRAINALLNQFGVQAMAKEALICMTLGLGATASRITESVKDALVTTASSLRDAPMPPSDEVNIRRPSIGEQFLDPAKLFSVTGSPPIGQQIAEIILNTLANAAFEVVKSLAEMIQFNCADIWSGLLGQVDIGDELQRLNNQAATAGGIPNLATLLQEKFSQFGINPDQAYAYLSDLSNILDPIEVCRLLNSQREVENSTYSKILNFNQTYSNEAISINISNRGQVNAFFTAASSQVDTVSICNDIINNNMMAAVQSCNICLDEDFVAPNQAISDLIDIAENGITLQIPDIDFLCEESVNYLQNPIVQRILPDLFTNVLDTTKIYMAGSLESARTSLLEPTVSLEMNPDLAAAFQNAGIEMEPQELNPDVMNFVTDLMGNISTAVNLISTSGVPCQDIDNAKLQMVVANINEVMAVVDAALAEVPEVIEEVNDKIGTLQQQGSVPGGGMPHTEYKFPESFRVRFADSLERPIEDSQPSVQIKSYDPGRPQVMGYRLGSNVEKSLYFAFARMYVDDLSPSTFENYRLESKLEGTPAVFGLPTGIGWSDFIAQNYFEYSNQSSENVSGLYTLDYQVPGTDLAGSLSDSLIPEGTSREFVLDNSNLYNIYGMNPYLVRFVGPIVDDRAIDLTDASGIADIARIVATEHSEVQRHMLDNLFDFIEREGAFNAARISNLNFFKINNNCPPESVGDLFDAEGILDQMKREFAAGACYDENSNTDKARNALYYGLIMMYVQAALVEFIIQNVTVFASFQMSSLIANQLIRDYMVNQTVDNLINSTLDGASIFEREIFNYFDRVSRRTPTILNGGITHSYDTSTVVPGYELDEDGQQALYPLNNRDLLRFLVEERINYTWDNGQRNTMLSITNILDPNRNTKDYGSIFIDDVLGPILNSADYDSDPIVESTQYANNVVIPGGSRASFFYNDLNVPGTTYDRLTNGTEPLPPPDPAASSNDFAWGGQWAMNDGEPAPGGLSGDAQYFLTSRAYGTANTTTFSGVSTTGDYFIAESTPSNEISIYVAILLNSSAGVNPNNGYDEMPGEYEIYQLATDYLASLNNPLYNNTLLINVEPMVKFQIQYPETFNGGGNLYVQHYGFQITGILNTEASITTDISEVAGTKFLYFLRDTPTDTVSLQYARFIDQAPFYEEVEMFSLQYGSGNSSVPDGYIRDLILQSDEYNQFFHQPFNMDAMLMYPILYNFYLTNRYFSDIQGSFSTVKRAILSYMEMTDNSTRPPLPRQPNDAFVNTLANNGQQDMQSMARDIFLKFLKETPIIILKGLVELIDPHVAISKIIKTATGEAFGQIANAISAALPDEGPASELTGDDILGLAFCAYSLANNTASSLGIPDAGEGAPLFGPRITLDGVDFKGTVSGMLMATPSPMGILYLLLEMLKQLLDQLPPEEENIDATEQPVEEC